MIKKLLNKIKSLFTKKGTISITESITEKPAEIKREIKITEEVLTCEHCKEKLEGKESAKDSDGSSYIWCRRCNYVNKINNGKVIRKENNGEEVLKAFKLFKQAGITATSYRFEKNGSTHSFR